MLEKDDRYLIGYARVSTAGQNLDLQIRALKDYGVPEDRIFTDIMTGSRSDRPGLITAMKFCRDGASLVVWKLDRLGRSLRGVLETIEKIQERGVELVVLTESIDTKTAMGKFVMHILAAMAQMERDLTIERTQAGLKAARERGVSIGRQDAMTPERVEQARKLLANPAASKAEIARKIGVSRARFFAWVKSEREAESGDADESI